jgi:hypothetical protein
LGTEKDSRYFDSATIAIPKLAAFKNGANYSFNL